VKTQHQPQNNNNKKKMYNFSYIPGREYNKNGKCSKKAAGCDSIAHQEVSIEKALPFDFISFFPNIKITQKRGHTRTTISPLLAKQNLTKNYTQRPGGGLWTSSRKKRKKKKKSKCAICMARYFSLFSPLV
jgi:hypothetical protein